MSNFQKILDSFSIQKTLNPKIWENPSNPEDAKMKSDVRKGLMRIAEEFIDYLGDDVFVEDVLLTGSLSNFNWSEYSDFDLHILVNMEEYGDEKELYKELFDLKKQVFNDKHDIKIYGYDVELYAQDTEESHYSTGVFSVMDDEWVSVPKKLKSEVDQKLLKTKIKCWVDKIDRAFETSETDDDKEILQKVKDKLKEYRKSGLEGKGELSYENLVFKFLRRSGHIQKLFDMANQVVDKELSIEGMIKEEVQVGGKNITDILMNSSFLKSLMGQVENNLKFEYTPGQKIPYEPPVELLQTALQHLGFSLPKWGVDGKFGPETKGAVEKFQEKNGLPVTGVFDVKDIKYLIAYLISQGFDDSELKNIQYKKDYGTENIVDQNFYKSLLENLGAPISDENLKFLYAWRQAEGKAGDYNPFNTTHRMQNSTSFNKVGVQNYETEEDGLNATIKTLKNGRYNCIVDGLRNDIGAAEIANCESLKTWGTGDLVKKVVSGYENGADVKIEPLGP